METIITKIIAFLIIIALGFFLKKIGVFERTDAKIISKIIIYLTLPCTILSSSKEIVINKVTIVLVLFALFVNVFTFYFGILFHRRDNSRLMNAVGALNVSGFNIGNYAIPFVQCFFASSAVGYICMFDIGNALCGFGLIYFLGSIYVDNNRKFDFIDLGNKLIHSVPFMTYILVVIISIFHLKLSASVYSFFSLVGNANTFLSMLLIGIILELKISKREFADASYIIVLRIVAQIICAAIILILPIPVQVKRVLPFCIFTPVTSVTPIYCIKLGYDGPLPAIVSTITMVSSIIIYVVMLIFLA